MQKDKLGFEESLGKEVISTGQCVGCATCVVVCPFNCLEYNKGKPKLAKKCETCGICPEVCPRYEWSWEKAEKFVFGQDAEAGKEFGVYRRLVLAQAQDKRILGKCQDGGAVTALIAYALQNGTIEGAAISGTAEKKPLLPIPKLATTLDEVIENAGTRYAYSPNMLALQEGVKQRMKSLAFVGTPCQIHAIRKIQMFPLKKYSNPLQFAVGLMCTESFSYEGFFEKHLKKNMRIDLGSIAKMNIKGKILLSLTTGEERSIPLSEAKQYIRPSCGFCNDFSAELADISAGGLGLSGWTFIILRTEKGEEIFEGAVRAEMLKTKSADDEPFAQTLLKKLTQKKLKNLPRN